MAEKRIGRNVDTGVCTLTRIVVLPYKAIQEFSYLLSQDKSHGGQKEKDFMQEWVCRLTSWIGATQISFQIYKKDICGQHRNIFGQKDIFNLASASAYCHEFCMAGKTWSISKLKVMSSSL